MGTPIRIIVSRKVENILDELSNRLPVGVRDADLNGAHRMQPLKDAIGPRQQVGRPLAGIGHGLTQQVARFDKSYLDGDILTRQDASEFTDMV